MVILSNALISCKHKTIKALNAKTTHSHWSGRLVIQRLGRHGLSAKTRQDVRSARISLTFLQHHRDQQQFLPAAYYLRQQNRGQTGSRATKSLPSRLSCTASSHTNEAKRLNRMKRTFAKEWTYLRKPASSVRCYFSFPGRSKTMLTNESTSRSSSNALPIIRWCLKCGTHRGTTRKFRVA